jgi:diguanylate cyclase (GGDEF)-like protein/PAS domain S-box-containing protein
MQDLAVASPPPLDTLLDTAKALFRVQDARLLSWPMNHDRPALAAPASPMAPGGAHPLAILWDGCDADTGGSLVVEDVTAHPAAAAACASLGLVAGFLAGARVGAGLAPAALLVLLDPRPRAFSPADRRSLAALAETVAALAAAEARAAEAERQAALFRLLADHSTDTLVRGNLQGDRLYISPGVRSLLGYEPAEMIGKRAADIMHPDDLAAFCEVMAGVRSGRIEQVTTEHRQRHRDGHWVWMEAHIRLTRDAATGTPDGYVVSVRDVSHRKATEARLEHAALHDPLTGLANRTLFRDRLLQEIARSRRTGAHFALFWIDLDRFKEVNDRLGHEAGDTVLRAVADRLRGTASADDTVARIGGDEFVLLRPAAGQVGSAEAAALAARLVATMDAPVDCAGGPVRIGLSVGVSLSEVEGLEADRLLRAADEALYRAKGAGRGRAVVAR